MGAASGWGPGDLGSGLHSATDLLCDRRQCACHLWGLALSNVSASGMDPSDRLSQPERMGQQQLGPRLPKSSSPDASPRVLYQAGKGSDFKTRTEPHLLVSNQEARHEQGDNQK